MIYGSVCSGIEAATVAWHPLGWKPAFFAEIDKNPAALLKHHYPAVPNHGDFTTVQKGTYDPIDALVGGTPCQDFSVAGLRAGLDGKRGQLTIEFANLAGRLRPRWLVWENVPGVLSIDGGRAFGMLLGVLGKLGYGFAYRVLDAQYFGVPQRRRRVFVVGYLGDWRRAAAVLFERHSLSGYPAPRREKGQVAPTIPARSLGGGGLGTDFDCDGGLVESVCMSTGQAGAEIGIGIGTTLNCNHEAPIVTHALRGEGFDASEDGTGRGTPLIVTPPITGNPYGDHESREGLLVPVAHLDVLPCMQNGADTPAGHNARSGDTKDSYIAPMAFSNVSDGSSARSASDICDPITTRHGDPGMVAYPVAFQEAPTGVREYAQAGTLRAAGPGHDPVGTRLRIGSAVRRLTPCECERLQGFPDDYTLVPCGKRMMADGPRYKMLGNSMAVPVMRWIGERIQMVDAL